MTAAHEGVRRHLLTGEAIETVAPAAAGARSPLFAEAGGMLRPRANEAGGTGTHGATTPQKVPSTPTKKRPAASLASATDSFAAMRRIPVIW